MMGIVLPTVGKGVIIRRSFIEKAAARWSIDMRAIRLMQRLRGKYGSRPLLIDIPLHPYLRLLDARDVKTVLEHSPELFATASWEKRAALAHLEPGNVLVSAAPRRAELRPGHEHALATERRHHPAAKRFMRIVDEEINILLDRNSSSEFTWSLFSKAWFRIVRRMILGDGARDDQDFTEKLNRLRRRANWAFLLRRDKAQLDAFQARLRAYIDGAEEGSQVARLPRDRDLDPESQMTQWLFAFDPAGMATFRALALLASHPKQMKRVRKEAAAGGPDRPVARPAFWKRCGYGRLRRAFSGS
ncbi:hypothetical protein [Neorhizobium petrolearium]|uniref:hypothetical protein n=1 Tax=Neorhizobium petrolearium TaxID=515361 RepID=UPI003F5CD620